MKKHILLIIFVFSLQAQFSFQDSLRYSNSSTSWYERTTPYYLLGLGLLTLEDDGLFNRFGVRKIRNSFVPRFKNTIDDYTQFAPLGLVYGLNLFGVKGRNTVGEASKRMGYSLLLTGATVLALKSLTQVERPDGSTRNAFPSGHTATAFVSATILHKEFGETVNPYYSFAGYTLASMTGIYRILNNRHWVSDVFFGAGIGIMATEYVYHVMGDRQYNGIYDGIFSFRNPNRAFLNYTLGYSQFTNSQNDATNFPLDGFSFGIEGAYFFNDLVGFGGHFKLTRFPFEKASTSNENQYSAISNVKTTDALNIISFMYGPYFKYELSNRSIFNVKTLFGMVNYSGGIVRTKVNDPSTSIFNANNETLTKYSTESEMGFELGVSYTYKLSNFHGLKLFCDFTYAKPDIHYSTLSQIDPDGKPIFTQNKRETLFNSNYFNYGLSYVVNF